MWANTIQKEQAPQARADTNFIYKEAKWNTGGHPQPDLISFVLVYLWLHIDFFTCLEKNCNGPNVCLSFWLHPNSTPALPVAKMLQIYHIGINTIFWN